MKSLYKRSLYFRSRPKGEVQAISLDVSNVLEVVIYVPNSYRKSQYNSDMCAMGGDIDVNQVFTGRRVLVLVAFTELIG